MDRFHLELPKELEPYRKQIGKTLKPVVRITAKRGETTLFESKFGGKPYMPKGFEHPRDSEGNAMVLFAQINFAEVPPIEPMPRSGILQFFLSPTDDVYGLDFGDPTNQANFRVVYHADVIDDETQLVTDFSYVLEVSEDIGPICYEGRMSFELEALPVSAASYEFEQLSEIDFDQETGRENETLYDLYINIDGGDGHKIGGYPYFTQYDPREHDEDYRAYNILLFQADMDDEIGLMFGDSGVANFFIKEKDLRNLNFSDVLYNWDCC